MEIVFNSDDILVVDDEASVVEVVSLYLKREGFSVRSARDGIQALAAIRDRLPDLLILDLMLPKVDGIEIMHRLKDEQTTDVPVIMLTARGQETDRIYGLELGADDYVVKPFSPAELVARVKAVLRRSGSGAGTQSGERKLEFEDLTIDPLTRVVQARGQEVELENVWGFSDYVDPSTVTVHIRRLREKIEVDPSHPLYLLTVWGVGYKFDPGVKM
jgi:two-component system response regulator ResD